ncbi:DUF4199 domain-containing protein [uncultured Maribacter sp.]|uniref:DUF4199 domain-containing protein n=1 Tax=uncultured Maribacter sp. TaxID=431308 RepID=UPI00262B8EEF|nr:DUF4199 domain-containing protein [uncultured Maribacter sp.]
MEENKIKTSSFALTYGLILGAVSVIFALMLYSADLHYKGGMMVGIISMVLTLAAIIIGMLQFKKANNTYMTFGQGLKVGVGIALIGGIIGILFNLLMVSVIDPDMMDKALEFQKSELMANTKLTSEQIDSQLEMGKKFSTPTMQILFGLLFSIVIGFVFSLIPALAMKKEEILN